jgi:hypothetical protein
MKTRRQKLGRLALLSAGALAFLAFAAPEASSVHLRSTAGLDSGSYQVVARLGGRTYPSVWHLKVVASHLTGFSEWDCCPGRRVDKLQGRITAGSLITITRDCRGQGYAGSCQQVYEGSFVSDSSPTLAGTWSGTGGSGTWTLYLNRIDVSFSVRVGNGTPAKPVSGLADALLAGGGRLVNPDYEGDSYPPDVTAVLALRLVYNGRSDVRVSLRADPAGSARISMREGLIVDLKVFQSNVPTCPAVGAKAELRLAEQASGDTASLRICGNTISWAHAAVTFKLIRGRS